MRTAILVGRFMTNKYRQQRMMLGTPSAARNLRKQGVPMWLALRVLGIRPLDSVPPATGEPPRR